MLLIAPQRYDRAVSSAALVLWRRVEKIPVLEQDAIMYFLSALFAFATLLFAVSADYREWGAMAGVAYLLGCGICLVASARSRRGFVSAVHIGWIRRFVVVLLLLGAVLIPLVAELTWRAEGRPGAHAQPEVSVIERAGDRAAHRHSPYLAKPHNVGVAPHNDARNVDAEAYFPYLPGMVPFGLLNSASLPAELTDARVALAGFTLIVGAAALMASDASIGRRGRALQFLVVLPSGALPMVTGGDDLPVLALMLLGLVLAQRRRPVLAGIAVGLAATLKFTAWPLLVLLAFAVRDRENRPAPLRYSLATLLVVGPIIGAGVASSPASFVVNVIKFPLGLTGVKSPAASPLLGQVLTNLMPGDRRLITFLLLATGFVIACYALAWYRPRTPASIARFIAFVMCLATVLAPATRFGYLIYPANFIVWGYVLDGVPTRPSRQESEDDVYSSSSTSKILSTTVLVGATDPPESAGLKDGFAEVTTAPTSQ
jgi:MFS family permease